MVNWKAWFFKRTSPLENWNSRVKDSLDKIEKDLENYLRNVQKLPLPVRSLPPSADTLPPLLVEARTLLALSQDEDHVSLLKTTLRSLSRRLDDLGLTPTSSLNFAEFKDFFLSLGILRENRSRIYDVLPIDPFQGSSPMFLSSYYRTLHKELFELRKSLLSILEHRREGSVEALRFYDSLVRADPLLKTVLADIRSKDRNQLRSSLASALNLLEEHSAERAAANILRHPDGAAAHYEQVIDNQMAIIRFHLDILQKQLADWPS